MIRCGSPWAYDGFGPLANRDSVWEFLDLIHAQTRFTVRLAVAPAPHPSGIWQVSTVGLFGMFAQSATCSGGVFRRRTTRENVRLARIATTLYMWTSGVHFVLRCGTPRSGLRTCLWATRCVLLCGPTLLRTCLWATWGAAGHGGTVGSACAAADASTIKARPLHSCCVVGGEAPHISEGFPRALVMQSQGFDPGSLLCKTLGSTRELRG